MPDRKPFPVSQTMLNLLQLLGILIIIVLLLLVFVPEKRQKPVVPGLPPEATFQLDLDEFNILVNGIDTQLKAIDYSKTPDEIRQQVELIRRRITIARMNPDGDSK